MVIARKRRADYRLTPNQDVGFYADVAEIDPYGLCPFPPGSYEKVLLLTARYQHGQPLFQRGDCSDHGHPIQDDPVFDPETDAVLIGADEDGDEDEPDELY